MLSPKVLIAEDNRWILEGLAHLARSVGCEVHGAADGQEAIDACRAQTFDLVITDVHMPRLDAFALITALRALPDHGDVPVIVVTGDATRSTKIALLEAGADDFLLKPVDPVEFEQRLRRQLRKSDLVVNLGRMTAPSCLARAFRGGGTLS